MSKCGYGNFWSLRLPSCRLSLHSKVQHWQTCDGSQLCHCVLGLLGSSLSGIDGAGQVYCKACHPCPGAPAILYYPPLGTIWLPLWPQWYGLLQQGVEGGGQSWQDKCREREAERTQCSLKVCLCASLQVVYSDRNQQFKSMLTCM